MIDASVFDQSKFNPLVKNPLKTRDDVAQACIDTFTPLLPLFSPGKARVQVDSSGAAFDRASSDLEGFSRPLFGLAPLAHGGYDFAHWPLFVEGVSNGTDPEHKEFWGTYTQFNQRQVEAAALGFALIFARDKLWDPLSAKAKKDLATYLINSRNTEHHRNNHKFFRVIVDLGLGNVGVEVDESMTQAYLDDMDYEYMSEGYYRDGDDDGDTRRIDYYNPFAMHFYGLVYAYVRPEEDRSKRFIERAVLFANEYQHWFDGETGANVPYGRSLIYRQAVTSFWAALALVNAPIDIPWGVVKGIYLRNLRWWAQQPICRFNDGIQTVGYAYPNTFFSERYNSAGSPFWSMKCFASLAVPPEHPFWADEELPLQQRPQTHASKVVGMVFSHQPKHTVMYVSGPGTVQSMRHVPEKYQKFAYSTRYGFSVESDARHFDNGAYDSMIAFSEFGKDFVVRDISIDARIKGDRLYSKWAPYPDVLVETYTIPLGPWHARVHKIESKRQLQTIEGGFATPKTDHDLEVTNVTAHSASILSTTGDFSGIVDVSESRNRTPRAYSPHGNTSLMFPRTMIPQLVGTVPAGQTTVFSTAVYAQPTGDHDWAQVPKVPTISELEAEFRDSVQVDIVKHFKQRNL